MTAAASAFAFRAHTEVWVLVVAVVASYTYAIRRIGPVAVRPGETVVTGAQIRWFIGGALVLWIGSDWPLHDIAEQYLYSAHMLQHMMFSYFMPPMLLLAIPEWLARLLIGNGKVKAIVSWCVKPVVAGVAFNATIMITHIPGLVNRSATTPVLHYALHTVLVLTALSMWMSICGPIPEYRLAPGGTMIFLFANSVVPTVPAGWLTFAEGVVYKHYQSPTRVFGLSPTYDQQFAGVIMKVGGSVFLWTLVVIIFFRKFASAFNDDQRNRTRFPDAEMTTKIDEYDLTFDQVSAAFDRVPPAPEPDRPNV